MCIRLSVCMSVCLYLGVEKSETEVVEERGAEIEIQAQGLRRMDACLYCRWFLAWSSWVRHGPPRVGYVWYVWYIL